ncbi:HAD family hydrolase [Mycoplasmopsis bovis]|uniref:HAD family hydrolase n=1 Tax=Mycoplasmopsis bovis TaxID=28903 RepID=UPI000E105069|nr:HAD family hydrolase [Mycoplasmopsis bovis]AXJ68773.1 HAD family hydrolase [Mycoplasmopsis bovis]AXJ74448.1 HAD family hydrolase [Mycoplasmopsis bovis]MBT1316395.1 HAD family phosphatase [Mycoplasmopsis bovis]MBT1363611.1 HAD family phosphatase [Mycoplasmopsis bovis]MBT1367922.1 HAD family phosphatase [Mycoplasmopsis bovis]
MKIKRIVFSDVDGTICSFPDKKENPETRKSILEAIENENITFVLNTGNPPLPKILKMANELNAKYLVAANGSAILDVEKNEYLYESELSSEIVDKVLKIIKKYDESACFFGKNGYYMVTSNQKVKDFLTEFFEYPNWLYEDAKIFNDIFKIEIYSRPENKDKIVTDIHNLNVLADLAVMGMHMELTAPGVNKGTGALWLCNHLDANPDFCMSIGDSNNDLSMLKTIGFSYAMDNSPKSVKEVARYFTSDVMQNGLGEAIQDYIFRTKFDIMRQENEDKLEKRKIKEAKNEFYRAKANDK